MKASLGTFALGWNATKPTHSRPPLTPVDFVELAAKLGFLGAQFSDNLPLHELTDAERGQLRERADELGLFLEVGTRGLTEENLNSYTKIAQELGSPFLRMVIDGPGHHPNQQEIIKTISVALPRLEDADIVLAIENHDRFLAEELKEILLSCNSRQVGICLDTANSFGAGEDPNTVISALAPFTINLHCKDITLKRLDHQQGIIVRGTPFGDGQLPMKQIVEQLLNHAECRCASMTLEHWIEPEPSNAATYDKALKWCQASSLAMRSCFPEAFSPITV